MKLLFIDFTLPYLLRDANHPVGGWAVELQAWLQGLAGVGHDSAVLTLDALPDLPTCVGRTQFLPVYRPSQGIPVIRYVAGFLPRLYRAAKEYRPDVILQAVAGANTGLMCLVAKTLKVPFVYRVANDIDVDARYKERLKGWQAYLFAFGLKRADAFIAQNTYQQATLRARFPGKPVTVIHNPFIFSQAAPTPVARNLREYVAWIGVFQKQKNLPLLMQIARNLPQVEFRVAGKAQEGGVSDEATGAALLELEKLPNVRFVGYLQRKDVQPFLERAICLLSTSHYEGFSNTFLEAWAAGTPIVAPARVDPGGLIHRTGFGRAVEDENRIGEELLEIVNAPCGTYDATSRLSMDYVRTQHDPILLAKSMTNFLDATIRK